MLQLSRQDRSQAELLLKTFTEHALSGAVFFDKNLVATINNAIDAIDLVLSKQLSKIIHDESFKKLEGSWRGLKNLLFESETSTNLRIRMMNITKHECFRDLDKAVEFDQSQLYRKIYESEYGTPGGEPYAAIVGDFEFCNHPNDIDMLRNLSAISAASFCPFISAVSPELFGFSAWKDLV